MPFYQILSYFQSLTTPQSEPIPGRFDMQRNSAGGFVFTLDAWARLDRYLILGTEGATYYATERQHTMQAVESVRACIGLDGRRTVARIVEISDSGRAPKNDPAILALAMCMKLGDEPTRKAAQQAVPQICRTGTHLFHLAAAMEAIGGGWGRGTRRAFAQWYLAMEPSRLAYQVAKYQARDGWSHRDVLRLAKPAGHERGGPHDRILGWVAKGASAPDDGPTALLAAFDRAKRAETPAETIALIREFDLPRECIRTEHLSDVGVWEALLVQGRGMPITALLRNLGKMASLGMLSTGSSATKLVTDRLADTKGLVHGRVHPLAVLIAMLTYRSGRGVKGSLSWTPTSAVTDALDAAFYASFKAVRPSGKRHLLGVDISGSMDAGQIAGLPGVTPRIAAAAMAMVTAASETCDAFGFTTGPSRPIDLSSRRRLDDVVTEMRGMPMGSTDCARPVLDALERRIPAEVFVVYTDNETWAGGEHPAMALRRYREATGIPARMIVVGLTATQFSIADPTDAGMLDVVGFDTAAPALMADFAKG